jgi:peptidoglycan/LPS O-acetylase OafA/YrhL
MSDQLHRADGDLGLGPPPSSGRKTHEGITSDSARVHAVPSSLRASTERRVVELDGLRGLACLAILVYHFRPPLVPYGWSSVDLFFVLSGYLITTILIRHEGSPCLLRNFYVRRGLRIWPVYYVTIFTLVIVGPWLPRPSDWSGLGYYLTYTQNLPLYWSGAVPPFSPYVAHLWTLANEEQFYILWPILVVMLGRRAVIPLTLGLVVLSVAVRAWGFNSWLMLARADGFALGGVVAAILVNSEKVDRHRATYQRGFASITLIALAIVIVVLARGTLPTFGRPPEGAAFSVLAINLLFAAVVGLVVTHAGRPTLAWLRRPRLVHLGTLSYGLYVYHYVVLVLSDDLLVALRGHGRTSLINVPVSVLIYALAAVSWARFEQPLLDMKGRFPYRASSDQETDSETLLAIDQVAARSSGLTPSETIDTTLGFRTTMTTKTGSFEKRLT